MAKKTTVKPVQKRTRSGAPKLEPEKFLREQELIIDRRFEKKRVQKKYVPESITIPMDQKLREHKYVTYSAFTNDVLESLNTGVKQIILDSSNVYFYPLAFWNEVVCPLRDKKEIKWIMRDTLKPILNKALKSVQLEPKDIFKNI